MIFYIADTHFGHDNIIRNCDRPFADADEMDRIIISNWNARVRDEDTVYVLGDVAYKYDTEELKAILKKLNGRKHLLLGNHDGGWTAETWAKNCFESVNFMIEISDNGRLCTLCHYPMMSWHHEKKAYMIYGHIHNNTDIEYWQYIALKDRMLNAGVEVNNYMPVTLDELIINNRMFKDSLKGEKL